MPHVPPPRASMSSGKSRSSEYYRNVGQEAFRRLQGLNETEKNKNFLEKHNKKINYLFNGGASLLNFITFVNGNFHFLDGIQGFLEKFSEYYTKCATGIQGILGAEACIRFRNVIPLIGNALEVPIAYFSSGFNLFLMRGISQSLNQTLRIIDQREVINKDGKPKLDRYNVPYVIGGDFSKGGNGLGLMNGFTTMIKEFGKMVMELFKKPSSNIKKLSHALFFVSIFQFVGGMIGLLGLKKIGAFIRSVAGAGVDFSLMRDKNIRKKTTSTDSDEEEETLKRIELFLKSEKLDEEIGIKKDTSTIEKIRLLYDKFTKKHPPKSGLNFGSPFLWAGTVWIGAEVVDFLKRFDYIADKIKSLTNLSLFFDRGASTIYTAGYLGMSDEPLSPEEKLLYAIFSRNPAKQVA